MSNKRKLKMNPIQVAATKRALRCPDCNSNVKIKETHVDVEHDDECPTRAELVASGRAYGDAAGLLVVERDGQTEHVAFGKLPGLDVPVMVLGRTPYRESRA